jgi:fibronectin type 3 domain-containing protein
VDVEVKNNNYVIYASSGYGGGNLKTNSQGRIENILVTDRVFIKNNIASDYSTDISVKKIMTEYTWQEERSNINMRTSHTEVFVAKEVLIPSSPTGLKVIRESNSNSLNISWDQNSGTSYYSVHLLNSNDWVKLVEVDHPQNWTNHENLKDDETYYYKLKAWNSDGLSSQFSEGASYFLDDITPPSIPEGLNAKPMQNDDALGISWIENTDDTINYELHWWNSELNDFESIANISHPEIYYKFSSNSLVNGNKYQFKVRAQDKVSHVSEFSPTVEVEHIDYLAPNSPTNLNCQALSETTISLSWIAPEVRDIRSYKIFKNEPGKGSGGPYAQIARTGDLSYQAANLNPDTTYYFVVQAVDEANNTSPNSIEGSARTLKDKVVPRITQTIPAQNAEDVAVNSVIEFSFNTPMSPQSVGNAIEIIPSIGYSTQWSQSNTVLKINFNQELSSNTTYQVTIKSSKSYDGLDLENAPFTLTFTTLEIIEKPKIQPRIIVLNPVTNSLVRPREMMRIFGTSIGLENGTEIIVYLGDSSKRCLVDTLGNWSIMFKAPEAEGIYSIIVETENISATVFIDVEKIIGPDKILDPNDNSTNTSKKDNNGKKYIKNKNFLSLLENNYLILVYVAVIILVMTFLLIRNKKRKNRKDFRDIINVSQNSNKTSKNNNDDKEQNRGDFEGSENDNSETTIPSEVITNESTIELNRDPLPGTESERESMHGMVGMKGLMSKSKHMKIKNIKKIKKGPSHKQRIDDLKSIEKPVKMENLENPEDETDIKNDDDFIQKALEELNLTDDEVDPIGSDDLEKDFDDMILDLDEFGELLADIENDNNIEITTLQPDLEDFNASELINDLEEFDGEL